MQLEKVGGSPALLQFIHEYHDNSPHIRQSISLNQKMPTCQGIIKKVNLQMAVKEKSQDDHSY